MESGARTIIVLILSSALVSCSTAGGGLLSSPGGRLGLGGEMIFNVLNFGAKPGQRQESTQAFIQAWDAVCNFNGRVRLLIPPGVYKLSETTFGGPCKSQFPIIVQVQGTLQAVT
ncbi:exopolygalacturonase-like [Forsythia ovata]|uniref:Exopolygalacturonase-like n=1 Tax=Forsythia ovata TaxID=205694 RepID=A0ABD1UZW2_9LAMI